MRLYQPIWEQLKKTGQVSVTANRLLHPRILKAVVKEKWLDVGHRMDILPYHSILTHSAKGAVLTFTLTKYLHPTAHISTSDI